MCRTDDHILLSLVVSFLSMECDTERECLIEGLKNIEEGI